MGGIHLSVDGIPELQAALEELPLYVRATILPPIYQEAGQVVLNAILANTPRKTGRLAKDIKMIDAQVLGEPGVAIGPTFRKAKYAGIVEGGASAHGGNPGFAGRLYFNSAFDQTKDAAADLITTKTSAAIAAYWARQGGGL